MMRAGHIADYASANPNWSPQAQADRRLLRGAGAVYAVGPGVGCA